MHQFIEGTSILKQIKAMLDSTAKMDLAVAFWGRGAIEMLGLSSEKPTRILCDALSGGCNPNELRELFKLSKKPASFEVRHRDKLHAKVYITPTAVVVGSANASSNGLGNEGKIGTLEAAIKSTSDPIVEATAKWFEEEWKNAKPIDKKLLKEAEEAYRGRFSKPTDGKTVLETLFENPVWFRNRVRLVAIVGDTDDAADRAFEKFGRRQFTKQELAKFDKLGFDPYYQNDAPLSKVEKFAQAGDYILDCTDGSELQINQLRPNPYIPYGDNNSISLVEPKPNVLGRKFSPSERMVLRHAVKDYLAQTGIHPDKFGYYLDELPPELMKLIRTHYDASLARGSKTKRSA